MAHRDSLYNATAQPRDEEEPSAHIAAVITAYMRSYPYHYARRFLARETGHACLYTTTPTRLPP